MCVCVCVCVCGVCVHAHRYQEQTDGYQRHGVVGRRNGWVVFCFLDFPVQFSHSVVSNSATPRIAVRQASLSITNSQSSLRLTSIESVMPSSHLILCCPLLLLPPVPPSLKIKISTKMHKCIITCL